MARVWHFFKVLVLEVLLFFFTFFFDLLPTCLRLWWTCWRLKLVDNNGGDLDEDLAARLVARLVARLDSILDSILDDSLDWDLDLNLDSILDRMLESSLDSILDANLVTGSGAGGRGNFRLDLGYNGGVDRELILGRDLDLDWFLSDPRVIASLGIEDMERRFNLPPVENPGYHL